MNSEKKLFDLRVTFAPGFYLNTVVRGVSCRYYLAAKIVPLLCCNSGCTILMRVKALIRVRKILCCICSAVNSKKEYLIVFEANASRFQRLLLK